jgi:hypothetical protein
MKKLYFIISFIAGLFMFTQLNGFSQTGNISLKISNINQFENYLCEKSYFQLVKYPSKGMAGLSFTVSKLSCQLNNDSTNIEYSALNIVSNLPLVNYLHNSDLSINLAGVKPGKYIIALQNIPGKVAGSVIDNSTKKVKVIEITKQSQKGGIDLGSVFLYIDLRGTVK